MADFASGYEDWGLQAIVEGSSNFSMENNNNYNNNYNSHQQYYFNNCYGDDHNLRLAFSELFGNQNSSMVMDSDNGLEAFYKPFYPISDSISSISDHKQVQNKIETEENLVEVKMQNHDADQSATVTQATDDATKCKKSCRKNQRKRVVVQVTADDFSSDKWAWRKYGQKPIKGSIYPRSYYKCSSMKACLARKQVEQSCSDPSKYIITYTAEHCHTHPTRRNSLAGTVRNRFPTSTTVHHPKSSSSNDNDHVIISPKSSLVESSDQEISDRKVKQERLDDEEDDHEEQVVKQEFSISDIVMNDEFFAALDDF